MGSFRRRRLCCVVSRNDSILQRAVADERGVIKVPQLVAHFSFRPLEDHRVLLYSESFNTLLRGPIYCDLLPLLDGRHSYEDLVGALAASHAESIVRTALLALASRGFIVSAEHGMDPGTAAFWSSLGASPRFAEERLKASTVAITGDHGRLARQLEAMNVAVDPESPELSVHVCSDYLDSGHEAINRQHLAGATAWMLVRPTGTEPVFGPVFRPGGACWRCLAFRLWGHREVQSFLRSIAGDEGALQPRAAHSVVVDMVYGLVATEIAKWLVLEDLAAVHERAISLDVGQCETKTHLTVRRPQCPACGDEAALRPDRAPVPVRLAANPKRVRTSGGLRTISPEATLARYQHLVSPVSGVVTWVSRASPETDSWFHVYSARFNPFKRFTTLDSLRKNLGYMSLGKGTTPAQSKASAVCEAVEWYCAAFHGDEPRVRRRFSDLVGSGSCAAIHPNDVQLFSDGQLDNAAGPNADLHPSRDAPQRLDPEAELDWSPVWSLTERRHKYLPTSMLYFGMQVEGSEGSDRVVYRADSNGCAAGNTLEEAILQGFFELVERDALAVWWYNQLSRPGVDLQSFDDGFLASATDEYRRFHRTIWLLDVTSDLGIPVFVAISRRIDQDEEKILIGAGAHVEPHVAALRAVTEANQALMLSLERDIKLADHPYLAPAPDVSYRGKSDFPVLETSDLREDIERCRALVEAKGLEFLVLEQTRPDIGMPVARVIVPGLRHYGKRFAPGRLFDIPVEMGWRGSPRAEADLNPVPFEL